MDTKRSSGTVPVLFADAWWTTDLDRASAAAREVASRSRNRLERSGVPRAELRACAPEGRDGTMLRGCFKLYLGDPSREGPGRFGMVFAAAKIEERVVMVCLAFGLRHQARGSHHPTVYEIAHARLHGERP